MNSYGYSRVTYMHGPKFNAETQSMFTVANTAGLTGNVTV